MHTPSAVIAESHRSAATLYLSGELTPERVMEALAHIAGLPGHIGAVCLDLRAVLTVPAPALRAIELALRDWRAASRGVSRVKLADDVDVSLVAIRFAHRRWSSTSSRDVAPASLRLPGRIRDNRAPS
ncbi:MAG: hypothetical protein ACT4PJ_00585 [Gemmatimonadaceae bacterium]